MTKRDAETIAPFRGHATTASATSARDRTAALLALTGATAIWGSTFVVTKALLDESEPFFIVVARLTLALIILWPLFGRRRGERPMLPLTPPFIALGLLGVAGNFGLQTVGLSYTGAADAALIVAITPVAVAVLAAVFLDERLVPRKLIGIGVSIAGVIAITGIGGAATPAGMLGNFLVIGSTLSWAGYTILGKRLGTQSHGAGVITIATIGWGLVLLLPVAIVEMIVSAPELSLRGVAALAYLGIGGSGVAFLLWNYALGAIGALVAGAFLNLIPVFGVALALVVGESLSLGQVAGAVAVGVGVWLAAWRPDDDPRA
jgi:drug/metabolite transporter (DMT)-like permease